MCSYYSFVFTHTNIKLYGSHLVEDSRTVGIAVSEALQYDLL